MHLLRAVIAAALLVLATPAFAQERILDFHSLIEVQPDSSMIVTETIDVRSEGNRILHGIFRDFPTRYKVPRGGEKRVGFDVIDVQRNGRAEPFTREPIFGGVRVKIGDAGTTLVPGQYRYVLRYRTTRQLGRFDKFDELYWNVTGNGWDFVIDRAQAEVRLPKPATYGERAVYTGAAGSTDAYARVVDEQRGVIRFETTAPLQPRQGLTIAAAWPKGVIAETEESYWLADFGPPLVGIVSLIGLCFFYWHAWRTVGRDPRPGTVVPLFSPNDGLSPPAMRYIWKQGCDNRAFAAALVDLGVRGHLRIVEKDGGFFSSTKRWIEGLRSSADAPAEERSMLGALVLPGQQIEMQQKHHAKFSSAMSSLNSVLAEQHEGVMFKRNWGWALAGLALWLLALWVTAAAVVAATGMVELLRVGVAVGATVTTAMLLMLVQQSTSLVRWALLAGAFVFGAGAIALGFPILAAAFQSGWLLPLAFPLAGLVLVISAFVWISAPTREGRAVLDRIMGFRQYLSITERDRLDRLTAPEDTPELFERYLPYAIALGVENRWADRFSGVLASASVAGHSGFGWYSGSGSPWNDVQGFTSSIGSTLASSIASASTAPGSGGGGSSGGGGGGGGGGGW